MFKYVIPFIFLGDLFVNVPCPHVSSCIVHIVEAAVCRQLISARRPSRDSRYAAFLSIHCAYTLVAHTCVITVIPHMCIQINCTVLNCLPYCLVVYASATIFTNVKRVILLILPDFSHCLPLGFRVVLFR